MNKLATPSLVNIAGNNQALVIAGSGLIAGGVSVLAGGSFGDGALLGIMATVLNEYGGKFEDWFKERFSSFERASEIMYEELDSGNTGRNGLGDARRHANGMKRITEELGAGTAAIVGVGHEIKNIIDNNPSLNETIMDTVNNIKGIGAGITGAPINDADLLTIDQSFNHGYPSSQAYQNSPVVQAGGF